jgi:site-specific DNA-methyltransferase (adenine-specific)|tara:strand:- start:86 stop:757 length:672 start_codon:yes stop_codon:yes gene_type:complete
MRGQGKPQGIELLNMDCMKYMTGLEDNAFELAIVDPPYGIGENGDKAAGRNRFYNGEYKSFSGGDKDAPPLEYFVELQRVSKNQIVWGANHFINRIARGSPCWIVWDKITGSSDFADCELAYTSFKTTVRKFQFQWSGMLQGDMKNKEHRIHPTQKPVKLYDWLLSNYAKEGDKILDTHLGSGSSAIAAHYGGFDFVGCELDTDYFKAAQERFNDATKQQAMF